MVTAKAKNDKLPYEKVEMLVTPDYEIQRLVVNGQDLSILTFQFDGEKLNPPVNDAHVQVSDAGRRARWWTREGSE